MSSKLPAVAPCACNCRERSRETRRAETHVINERFDEAGFEVPFAASFEGVAVSQSEATFNAESESQGEAEAALSDSEWGTAEDEAEDEKYGVALGTLRHTSKNGKTFTYKFTEDDLLWTARYLMGEAGDDVERIAVLWTMVNRFAFYRARGKGWRTFTALLRAFSSPLSVPAEQCRRGVPALEELPRPKMPVRRSLCGVWVLRESDKRAESA